ncbi:MAG: 1-acyl-sn-glycerol-3-phosphate acyltransferase [Desulfobacterota bacterium]|nr:1-acyl-sn-glycerol-3-phosphate acyltransferase [Thermodesulfobacteriota bacterium]
MLVWLRTIFFWLTVFISLLFISPFVFFLQSEKKSLNWLARKWSKLLLFISGVKLKIQGEKKIDPSRSYIIMSNHQSYFDIFVLLFLPVFIHWLAKKELFRIPIFGMILKWIGSIEVDREDRVKGYGSIKKAVEKIKNGATVLIFPEGTRSPTDELLPFHKGGFSLAILSGAPILPVTIKGTNKVMAKGSFRVFPGTTNVIIHDPVETKNLSLKDRDWLQENIRKILQTNLKNYYPPHTASLT